MKDISVIVVSYNTKDTTKLALDAIQESFSLTPTLTYEINIIDNNSEDGSVEMLRSYKPISKNGSIHTIFNRENSGFGAANNQGIFKAEGEFILLLNSDVIADTVDFGNLLQYMEANPEVGVLTVRVELPSHSIDPASHRGFPTPWRSFSYFTKLQTLTKPLPLLNKIFGGYHLVHHDLTKIHEIDSPTAAFYLTRKKIMEKIKGFDETFFMYGEDIDMSYRIKALGYSIIYYPIYTVLHLKHQSGLKNKKKKTKSKTTYHFYNAMKIFYDKHYARKNPWVVNALIHKAIDFKYWLASR
jgi:GT2 family glycosyltransferase